MTAPGNATAASSAATAAVAAVGSPLTRVFVDTSGWADPILQNTTATAEMVATYRALLNRQQRLVTSNYVLTEVVALLTTRRANAGAPGTTRTTGVRGTAMSRPEIVQYIEDIQALPWVQMTFVDEVIHQEAWRRLRAAPDKDWSWVDASSFVIMRLQRITHVLTSDHHFAQAGFVPLPFQTP